MKTYDNRKPVILRLIDKLSETSGYLSGIALFLSSLVIFYQVLARYFFGIPTVWQTELSIYMLMFASFVGAAYGLKHRAHVGVDIVVEKLPPRVQSGLRLVTSLFCLALTLLVTWKAWGMWWEATEQGWKSSSLWGPPLTYPYFILPLGMTLVSLQYLVLIYEEFQSFRKGGAIETSAEDSSASA
ncbi:TRAP transporter small permease [Bacillaceae bacterium]